MKDIISIDNQFDIQGHRGCRGLYPENTIPAFMHALELGVNTLELDLARSKDGKIVVSHEPFFNHEITTHYDPTVKITKTNEKEFNLGNMEYAEIQKFDVGSKVFSRFPEQKKMEVHKPLLADVIDAATEKSKALGRNLPRYNVEIKSKPEWDKTFYPDIETFVDDVVQVLEDHGTTSVTTIQSFDLRALVYTHQKYPDIETVLLIENNKSISENIEALGFIPDVYSPYFKLINKDVVAYCKVNNMKLIPWTVNSAEDMVFMIKLDVDGIITDYPDRLIAFRKQI